jgi:hypothetical protein
MMPDLDLTRLREAYMSLKKSTTISQTIIYNNVMKDTIYAVHYVDKVYTVASKYSKTNPANAKLSFAATCHINNSRKHPKPEDTLEKSEGRHPISFKMAWDRLPPKVTESLEYFWRFQNLSNMRGNDKSGFGGTTVGYYNFNMPANYVRAIARA